MKCKNSVKIKAIRGNAAAIVARARRAVLRHRAFRADGCAPFDKMACCMEPPAWVNSYQIEPVWMWGQTSRE
jgi:hypothetical protein